MGFSRSMRYTSNVDMNMLTILTFSRRMVIWTNVEMSMIRLIVTSFFCCTKKMCFEYIVGS